MKVYHGSDILISEIDLSRGRKNLDFGQGFYVTTIRKHAHQRAIDVAMRTGKTPVISEFEYWENYPNNAQMSVKRFHELSKEWVEFIIMNRDPQVISPAHSYDIVEGPIANDWVTFQIDRYQNGLISLETLIKNLKYREKTYQICFCTVESLWALRPIEATKWYDLEDISSAILIALQRDFALNMDSARRYFFKSTIYQHLTNPSSKLYDQHWQEIYKQLKIELGLQ